MGRKVEFLHTPEDKAAGGGVKGMVYAVYHRQSYDGRWVLTGQFRVPQRAEALIFDMIVAAIRRGLDLGMLAIVRIDIQIPYGKAPKSLRMVASAISPPREHRKGKSMNPSTLGIGLGELLGMVLDGQHRLGRSLSSSRST